MPLYSPQDELFASNSHFLSPAINNIRKSPSRQSISLRRSATNLRGPSSLAHAIDDDEPQALGGHHSLAHELAVALMPEPSAGSKLLAEEFGIEYDEGAEGIDGVPPNRDDGDHSGIESEMPSFADELGTSTSDASFHEIGSESEDPHQQEFDDPVFSSPTRSRKTVEKKVIEQDAMEVLAEDVEFTDKFLNHLRSMDVEPGSSQPTLERIASDVIRKVNDTVRDRETQVRELLECEREFRKIAGEVGGSEVLGQLEELTGIEELSDKPQVQPTRSEYTRRLDVLEEEPKSPTVPSHSRYQPSASDWELDPDRHHLGDEDYLTEPATSPLKDAFPPPPPITGPPSPATVVPQLSHLRSFTTSLVSSLTTISEQTQVNGAATSEAGRKIRALKNKLGSWRTDWDGAERSRLKIERWEAGIVDSDTPNTPLAPLSPGQRISKRIDGRTLVQEHIEAFQKALEEASLRTQAIMAR